MSNVLSEEKKQQVIALGRLGWALRQIEEATGIRRETAAGYLRAAGIPVRRPAAGAGETAKPANEVTTDSGAAKTGQWRGGDHRLRRGETKPPSPLPPAASEPYRELIEPALSRGRNAMSIWQELVDRPRLHRSLRKRQTLRPQAAWHTIAGSARRSFRPRPAKIMVSSASW